MNFSQIQDSKLLLHNKMTISQNEVFNFVFFFHFLQRYATKQVQIDVLSALYFIHSTSNYMEIDTK